MHGGRMAELETFENTFHIDKLKIINENVGFAEIFSHQILDFIMILIIIEDKSFIKTYQPIYDFIIDKVNDT